MNFINKILNNFSSLESIYLKSKKNEEYNNLFVNKFNSMYFNNKKMDVLLSTNYYEFQKVIKETIFPFTEREKHLKMFLDILKNEFNVVHRKTILDNDELFSQKSNIFLKRYSIDNLKYISEQRDVCLERYEINSKESIDALCSIFNSLDYHNQTYYFFNYETKKVLKDYINNLKENKFLQFEDFKNLYDFKIELKDQFYSLFEKVKPKEISKRLSFEILENHTTITYILSQKLLLNVYDTKDIKEQKNILKIIDKSNYKNKLQNDFNLLINDFKNDISKNKDKNDKMLLGLSALTLGAAISNSKKNGSNLFDDALDIGTGVAIGSITDRFFD